MFQEMLAAGSGGGSDLSGYKIVEHYCMINNSANSVAVFWKKSDNTKGTSDNFTGSYFSYAYSTSTVTALQNAKFLILTTDKDALGGEVKIVDGTPNQVLCSGNSWFYWFTSINPATYNAVMIAALVKQ